MNTVFQQYALFPHMSVLDNVAYGLKQRGVPKAERHGRAREALELVHLTARARPASPRSSPAASSSAWRSPARSSMRPKVLLLDEPLGALDLKLRKAMQIELKRLQEDGRHHLRRTSRTTRRRRWRCPTASP